MENSFFHRLSGILWVGIVLLLVLLAIYVSVGRMLAGNMGEYKTQILQELNARVPFLIEAQEVSGEWQSFTPIIVLSDLRLSVPGSPDAPLELSEGQLGVDVLDSLRTGSLQLTRVALNDLTLRGEMSDEGKLRFTGFGTGGGEIGDWLREFLLNVEMIALRNNLLKLTLPDGEMRDLDLNLLLSREGSQRRVDARLVSTRGANIAILAEGVGDPFRPDDFSGDLYFNIQTHDLGAVREMLPGDPLPLWADGAVDLKFWLDWDKGDPSVEMQLEGRDLMITKEQSDLQIPLERVALQAHLQQRKNNWTVFVSDLQLVQDGVELVLPRLQVDAWGSALQVRAADVPLRPLNTIASNVDELPPKLRDVLTVLQPQGQLSALQLRVGNIEQMQGDWEVEARFEELAVDSFKGAPGVTAASGFARLGPAGGFAVLDSPGLTMDFPSIYHQPLGFDDFYGTLYLDWDEEFVNLSSGLVTGRGEEGRMRVLFGLEIPLQKREAGIEMDLLVGFENTHPDYREKYLPHILNPALLNWLSDSIGDGHIAQGGFLWRGSLARDRASLRTVQLAFNLANTQLDYDPRWPPVNVQTGVVYIDDSAVSVWAEQATLLQSAAHNLSVESRLNKQRQVVLDIEGTMTGPAANGLQVLNESPIGDLVGGAFAGWQAEGELETDLTLQLNLGDKSVPPRVEVVTRWRDVDLLINPGNLPVQAVNGDFTYSTREGFSSDSLHAQLWDEPVVVSLEQQHADAGGYRAGESILNISHVAEVDLADIRRWLQLEPLGFASGETAAQVAVQVKPGEPPLLSVSSNLDGVALDLPQPWKKAADRPVPFSLLMPLGGGSSALTMTLGEQLQLDLDLEGGQLRGAALGIGVEPASIELGILRVTGHAPLVQGDQWITFVTEYFGVGAPRAAVVEETAEQAQAVQVQAEAAPAADTDAGDESEPGESTALKVVIEDLHADQLVILDQEVLEVVLNLVLKESAWDVAVDTDWLRGSFLLDRTGGRSSLQASHLDLSRLADFTFAGGGAEEGAEGAEGAEAAESTLDLPPMDVTLDNIYQAEARLGNLAFALHSTEGILRAQNIRGELASLRFSETEPASLTWHQGAQGNTRLQAALSFSDLGQTLQYFDYERIVETKNGSFDVDLRWWGTPQDFSLLHAQGAVLVNIGKGSFLEAPSGATGALRVVSILNLADIVRRLSLSHMFESGIPFDSVKGEIYLHDGTVEVARMDVQGGSSFQFSGVSDVQDKSLNGELVATLPVAKNLPWIAALAASLPVAAGVYIVSKVFDKQMNRLSSAVYDISGSWNDPQVTFTRVFDNSRQGESKSFTTTTGDDTVFSKESVTSGGETPGDELSGSQLLPQQAGGVEAESVEAKSVEADSLGTDIVETEKVELENSGPP